MKDELMFKEKLEKALEAIWGMCRKNELYTLEMFKQDMIGKILSLIADELPKEKLPIALLDKEGKEYLSPQDWEKRGFNRALKEVKTKLGVE